MMPYALGGAQLCGSRVLRFTYVDESGISNHEPFVIVAGVVIHGDDALAPVEDHLESLMRENIPERDWDSFHFHAKDLWQGTKYFKDRDVWPLERRMSLMRRLCWVPDAFDLSVVFGFHSREEIRQFVPRYNTVSAHDQSVLAHAYAFISMTVNLERHMKNKHPGEVTFLTVEDRPEVKKTLKELHQIIKRQGSELEFVAVADVLPLRRIRDTPHFAAKSECRLLQLADVCAFILNGHLRRVPGNDEFYDALWPALGFHFKGEVWPVAQWPYGPLFPFWESDYWQEKMPNGRGEP